MTTIRRPSSARQIVSLGKGEDAPAGGPYAIGDTSQTPIGPTPPAPSPSAGVAFAVGGSGDGEDGQPGPPGPPGPAGAAGAVGAVGPAGPPGFGVDGLDGLDGVSIPGPQGATGPTGLTGPQGPPGFQGFDGEEGPEGFAIPGVPGPQGPTGPQGPAGGGGWALISTTTITSQTTVTMLSAFTGYTDYQIELYNVTPSSGSTSLTMQFGNASGPTWIAASYFGGSTLGTNTGGTSQSFNNTSSIVIFGNMTVNSPVSPCYALLTVNQPGSSKIISIAGQIDFWASASPNAVTAGTLGGRYLGGGGPFDSFRLQCGAAFSGTLKLYGR